MNWKSNSCSTFYIDYVWVDRQIKRNNENKQINNRLWVKQRLKNIEVALLIKIRQELIYACLKPTKFTCYFLFKISYKPHNQFWFFLFGVDKYVVVPADKAQNNIVFVCKTFYFHYYTWQICRRTSRQSPKQHFIVCKTIYIQCLLSELDVENNSSDKTFTATTLSKEEIVENHKSVLSSFGLYQGRWLWFTVYVLDS